ncbi:PglY protein [Thermobifida halotolerans]|uniref:PglY protein n=1 Tax=Thermobifida halotolerans TaxID=483545 RepID=A0A399G5E3_9ACTN|nr:PglY protein [Thermobifida halotolerans]UOE19098.1 PglY protein [Thermobifida halotolerans]
MSPTTDVYLRDVLDIPAPDDVHAGDFKVELSGGFHETAARVDEYVVTDQLRTAFQQALNLVRAAVRDNASHAAYLHGSFGSGKSHFMTVLHAVLHRHPAALDKPRLREIILDHDAWLRERRFLMVPYHLVGATDLDSALLGGYVAAVRRQHPEAPTPAVYRADALLDDARANRAVEGDDLFIRKLAHSGGPDPDDDDLAPLDDDLAPLDAADTGWTSELLDRAFAAPHGDPLRERLVSALLSGPMKAYARGASGDADAFLPLDDGLSVISRHAQRLGYDGIILFIDELILWLQSHMSDQDFVKREVNKLVKIIESGNADRPVPLVSFISRQRNLSQLVGEDVTGIEVKNLEAQVEYLAERFDVINLEDRNLPAIIKERILKPRPGAGEIIDAAFTGVERAGAEVRDALLDAQGATGADWDDFRAVYPLTPALLNVLVALSGALQRERTGLKLIQDLLGRRRDDLKIGQVIPLGDLWDVLAAGMGGAFTERLKKEGEQAVRFYDRVEAYLREKYGADDPRYVSDLRLVKTLLLAYLAPDVAAFTRLTGRRLAALNHGSIKRTRVLDDARLATRHLRELQAEFGELRADGDEDPVFNLHLSDLDVEPLLDQVADHDTPGARLRWVRETLWKELGVTDTGEFVCKREVVWRGSRRTAEFVFGNVRDSQRLPDQEFEPSVTGHVRFVLDYPFDQPGHYPSDDAQRVHRLRQDERNHHPTVVWLPVHLSPQRAAQLGRLIRINHLLERDRLDDYATHLSTDDRMRLRNQLKAQRDSLESQLTTVLAQLYGIARLDEANTSTPLPEEGHVMSLLPDHRPRLAGGGGFETALYGLVDNLFDHLYPQHPDFDPRTTRKAVDVRDLRAVHSWISRAMEDGSRRVTVDRNQLSLVKRIVHPLELGEVHDGPLVLSTEWRRRIDQIAHQKNAGRDLSVAQLREWIEELGWTGLDTPVQDLIIATYALLSDRAWVHPYRGVESAPPDIGKISSGYLLRQQELPDEADFTTALNRAGALFGVGGIPPVLFARNVTRLAAAVREQARAAEPDVNGVYSLLTREQNATVLGLVGAFDSPRPLAARHAVDLVERVLRHTDDTPLVRELAAVAYDVDDQTLGRAVGSAGRMKRALETTDWQLLDQVRSLTGRDDTVGDGARKTINALAEAARSFDHPDDLAAALTKAQQEGRKLVNRALQLANITDPQPTPDPQPPVGTPNPVVTDPEQVSLTEHGDPPVSATVRSGATRRIPARSAPSALEQQMDGLLQEIREYAEQNPDAEIQVTWRAVAPADGEDA